MLPVVAPRDVWEEARLISVVAFNFHRFLAARTLIFRRGRGLEWREDDDSDGGEGEDVKRVNMLGATMTGEREKEWRE